MSVTFRDLFIEHVISSLDKQLRLAEYLENLEGEPGWSVDPRAGELTLAGNVTLTIQILGSEDHVNETWLWSWANPHLDGIDEPRRVANELRAYGEKHAIAEFVNAKPSLDEVDGHSLAIVASGLLGAGAYFLTPYEGGQGFVLVTDERLRFDVAPGERALRAAVVVPQAISAIEIEDHRQAVRAYFEQIGFTVRDDGDEVFAMDGESTALTAEFDDLDRLVDLTAHSKPAERR